MADGAEFDDGDYQGIGGITFCAGDDCSVTQDPDDSTILVLTGSWYFTPDDAEEKYIRNPADTEYVTDNKYVAFGHWLAANSGNAALTDVNTYATTASGGVVLLGTTADLTDTSATYTGTAVGMSVERTTDEDGAIESMESGAFTADVTLEATFGGSPTLGGTVSNFEGPGTDPAWAVELQVRSFSGGSFTDGVTITTDDTTIQKGVWSADAYGFTDERPTGVYGAFNAHFTDGHAAGAYAVRK